MLLISSKQIGSMETSVLLRFHECFQNLLMTKATLLLVVSVLALMVDETQSYWRLIAAGSQTLGSFWTDSYSSNIFLFICPITQAVYMLCTRYVGNLPRNCTLSFIQSLQQSQPQPGWVHLSTLTSFFCPY